MFKKSFKVIIPVIVLILILIGYLVIKDSSYTPDLYVQINSSAKIKCIKGGFAWNSFGKQVVADALAPTQMEYTKDSTIYVKPYEILEFTNSKNYNMYGKDIRVIDKYSNETVVATDSILKSSLQLIAPKNFGSYIYSITIDYLEKGSVQYGIKVVVTSDISKLEPYTDTYLGDNVKVSQILSLLPYSGYRNGMELLTSKEPYSIIINYDNINLNKKDLEFNSLALFTIIKNLDSITYNIKNGETIEKINITKDEITNKYELTIKELDDYVNGKHINEYGFVTLEKLGKNYTIDDATVDNYFINIIGRQRNIEVLEKFLSKVNNKENTFMRDVLVTVEGDPITRDIEYKDNIFTINTDYTRDKFASEDNRKIITNTYENINVTKSEDGKLKMIFLYNGDLEVVDQYSTKNRMYIYTDKYYFID